MKKILMLVAGLVALVGLSACGNTGNKAKDTLDDVKKRGTLVVATSPDFAPFEFQMIQEGKNQVVGSDIDLAKAIAKALDVKLDIQTMDFNTVLASLQSGKADLAISGLSATKERQAAYDFSKAYFTAKSLLVVKKDDLNKYAKSADFNGKKIGVQKGAVQEGLVSEQLPKAEIVSLPKNGNLINELKGGTIDAIAMEETIAKSYIQANPDLAALETVNLDSSDTDSFSIAMPKGADSLKAEVDKVITQLQADGKITQAIETNTKLAESALSDDK